MSKNFLDLKKFKHVKSDEKSTTLQHKDGHILTVAHKALSKDFQKQLCALAEGGEVASDGVVTVPSEYQGQESQDDNQEISAGPKMRPHNPKLEESKKTPPKPKFANGGVTAPSNEVAQVPIQASPEPEKKDDKGGGGIMKMLPMLAALAEGGEVSDDVGYLGSRKMPSTANPRQLAPSEQADYHDKTSPEQDKQRHMQADEAEKRGKAMGLYADGGEVPDALKMNDPQAPQSFDQMPQVPPQQVIQDAGQAKYQKTYTDAYDQAKSLNHNMEMLGYGPRQGAGTAFNAVDPVQQELSANKAAASAVAIQKEDEQADQAKQSLQNAEMSKVNAQRQALGLPPIPGTPVDTLATPNEVVQQEAPREPQSAPAPKDPHDPEAMLSGGYNKQMKGINAEAAAKGALGDEQATMLAKNIEAQQHAQSAYQQQYQELENERQAHMQDIKDGYIDPNAYWKDHSKVAAGIGMILAGFNPTNSPNAAVNFLKYQMDQNIQAQSKNLDAKQNMLAHNIQQFGNLRDATEMTRIMQTDILSHNLQMAAAKATTPMAKAAALQAAGHLQAEMAPQFQQFAMRRAMMGLANGGGSPQAVEQMMGYMRAVNPEMAKSMEARYVPGVGLSSVPVPDGVRKELVGKQQFSQALSDLYQWSAKHSGSVSPTDIVKGRTMAANVQNLYREAINGGVFKAGEQSFISNIIDSEPTKFFNSIRVLPKLQEAARENDASLNILKKTYGLPQAQHQAEPQYKTVNGVKYMRGPKGEAIRVK